ncbi:PadR family transcriptional regulator [Streptomyces oceani]|uniref:PadR family transcriptional regulator n=1 Tax=Streptomyces oceani TaxID=1075402 RepID=A0A1E7KLF4_9ACTN|nr:PadR family transcriptional regulator [Streptomyces oceani]OEV04775.1 PadR family transcriptional regulator [Streptomyces oceani]
MAPNDPTSDWQRGTLRLSLAAVLAEGDGHGYALVQRLAEYGLGAVRGGALYPVLGRMETDGLVESRWEAGDGGPGRKVYSLTEDGRARLRDEITRWQSFAEAMNQLMEHADKELP